MKPKKQKCKPKPIVINDDKIPVACGGDASAYTLDGGVLSEDVASTTLGSIPSLQPSKLMMFCSNPQANIYP